MIQDHRNNAHRTSLPAVVSTRETNRSSACSARTYRSRISPMFSMRYGLFATFCNRLSLFSSTYKLFFAKQGVGSGGRMAIFFQSQIDPPQKKKSPNRLGEAIRDFGGDCEDS